jgi:hypothetical protein
MLFNHRYFNFYSFILVIVFISSSSTATLFCSNLTSIDDKDTPCFLEPPTRNPALLRSAGNSLVLPCHVARSKHSTVEWWYQDFQKIINIKVYPVFPAVRPTVLRFITSTSPISKNSNETDIIDVSVLLRHINVDDSGIYRCVIRPWTGSNMNNIDDILMEENSNLPSLSYHVELTAPRLCQTSLGSLPCFSNMRTTSPTIVDAYQTAFLQCVVHNHNRPVTVFWVVGNASVNSVLVTDYLPTNQHNGDRLRRVFPLSPFDYSIELTINHDTHERAYSCVIDGATDVETTIFTYIVRSIDLQGISDKTTKARKNETTIITNDFESETSSVKTENIVAHDALTPEQIDELRHKNTHEHIKKKEKKLSADEDYDLLDFNTREEATTTR